MIDFVGTSPSLRKALWVAMATVYFHFAQTGLFMVFFFAFRAYLTVSKSAMSLN